MAASKVKAADKQTALKKLVAILKRHYGKLPSPRHDLPVLETLLYAVCLENVSVEQGEAAYARLQASFHDLNEIRVSSITEVAAALPQMPDSDVRALRILRVLQYAFDKHYAFELEGVRKKTLDLAQKQLGKIRDLSHFVRSYALQAALGAHLVPIDDASTAAAVWLGLVDPGSNPEQASEALKPVVRKAESDQISALLRGLATDPRVAPTLRRVDQSADPPDLATAHTRLTKLLGGADAGTLNGEDEDGAAARKTARASRPAGAKAASGKPDAPAAGHAGGRKSTKKGTRA